MNEDNWLDILEKIPQIKHKNKTFSILSVTGENELLFTSDLQT